MKSSSDTMRMIFGFSLLVILACLAAAIALDEAIALSAEVRAFEAEYEALEMPVPEWLVKSADVLREEIARRTKATKLTELKRLENEIEGYKSANEKRTEATKRLAALQNELGLSPAKSGR